MIIFLFYFWTYKLFKTGKMSDFSQCNYKKRNHSIAQICILVCQKLKKKTWVFKLNSQVRYIAPAWLQSVQYIKSRADICSLRYKRYCKISTGRHFCTFTRYNTFIPPNPSLNAIHHSLQLFSRMLQYCFAVKLQKYFVDYKTKPDLLSVWGWIDNDWILTQSELFL